MKKQVSSKIVSLVFSVLVICFAIAFYVVAWNEPAAPPPGGNIPAPLNTGPTGQSKEGGLILNTGGAATGLIIDQGAVGIGTTSPSVGEEVLKLDVEGAIGAMKYCDENGDNCKTITEIVAGAGESCQVLHPFNSSEAATQADYVVDVPSFCIDSPCTIILNRFYSDNSINDGKVVSYYQDSTLNYWAAGENPPLAGATVNGDGNQDNILALGGTDIMLHDDRGAENNPLKWTIEDNHITLAGELIVCSSGGGGGPAQSLTCQTITDSTQPHTPTCPAGTIVTGGGFDWPFSAGEIDHSIANYPSGNGWFCFGANIGITNCYAVCCSI